MKGPMKGATIAHAKQRRTVTRYIGLTEPGIIAAAVSLTYTLSSSTDTGAGYIKVPYALR